MKFEATFQEPVSSDRNTQDPILDFWAQEMQYQIFVIVTKSLRIKFRLGSLEVKVTHGIIWLDANMELNCGVELRKKVLSFGSPPQLSSVCVFALPGNYRENHLPTCSNFTTCQAGASPTMHVGGVALQCSSKFSTWDSMRRNSAISDQKSLCNNNYATTGPLVTPTSLTYNVCIHTHPKEIDPESRNK